MGETHFDRVKLTRNSYKEDEFSRCPQVVFNTPQGGTQCPCFAGISALEITLTY
jgi:hypothetical protein